MALGNYHKSGKCGRSRCYFLCDEGKTGDSYIYCRQKTVLFKVESWFLQHVKRWLKTTHAATPEWVENAIKQDEVKKKKEHISII